MNGVLRTLLTIVIVVVIFAGGAAAGWLARSKSTMRADVPTIAFYGGWRLACPPASQMDKPCAISDDLVDSKTQTRVAQLTIVAAKSGPLLVVTAPYDVLLTSGLGLVLGKDKPRVYPFQTCNLVGCVAAIALDPGLHAAMLQAKDGKLLFGSLNQKVVAIAFSLQEFRRADKALAASQTTRNFLGMTI